MLFFEAVKDFDLAVSWFFWPRRSPRRSAPQPIGVPRKLHTRFISRRRFAPVQPNNASQQVTYLENSVGVNKCVMTLISGNVGQRGVDPVKKRITSLAAVTSLVSGCHDINLGLFASTPNCPEGTPLATSITARGELEKTIRDPIKMKANGKV
ncbi:hypothetical protein ACFE04_022211 [Oxalis oulophora]